MAASSGSLISRDFGGVPRPTNKGGSDCAGFTNGVQMEENNVFHSGSDNTTVPSHLGKSRARKTQALSDSSNSSSSSRFKTSGRNAGMNAGKFFGFKKPTPLTASGKKTSQTKIVGVEDSCSKTKQGTNNKGSKIRSSSVPILGTEQQSQSDLDNINNFYDFNSDDWYPEPEFLRNISIQGEYVFKSPIEINLDETDEFIPTNEEDSISMDGYEINTDQDEVNDDDDDERYPEVEKYPSGYATQISALADPDKRMCYEKDDPSISESPPLLEYDLENDLSFMSDYLSTVLGNDSLGDIPEN